MITYDVDAHTNALAHYMPDGPLFEAKRVSDSNFRQLLRGFSGEIFSAQSNIELLGVEYLPDQTTLFLAEWERALAIPDDCFTGTGTNAERRRDILVKLVGMGLQTADDFENLAAVFGEAVNVLPGSEYGGYPFPVADDQKRYYIIIEFTPTGGGFPYTFPFVFGSETIRILECLFNNLKPSNCRVLFRRIQPPVPVEWIISDAAAPYLIGYNDDSTPWAVAPQQFLEAPPEEGVLVVKATADCVAYGVASPPYLRVFDGNGVGPLVLDTTVNGPVIDIEIDGANGLLWYLIEGTESPRAFNYTTGAQFTTGSADVGENRGIAVPDDGEEIFVSGSDGPVYLRGRKTQVLSEYVVNSPPSSACGKLAVRPNGDTVMVPFTAAPYVSIWTPSGATMFSQGAPNGNAMTGPGVFCQYNHAGTRCVLIGANEVQMFVVTGALAANYSNVATLPAGWPADSSVAAEACFSADDSTLLFSNGQAFDVTVVPYVEVPSPAVLPTAGTSCTIAAIPVEPPTPVPPGGNAPLYAVRTFRQYHDFSDADPLNWTGDNLTPASAELVNLFGDAVAGINLDMKDLKTNNNFILAAATGGEKSLFIIEDNDSIPRVIFIDTEEAASVRSVDITATVDASFASVNPLVAGVDSSSVSISLTADGTRAVIATVDPDAQFSNTVLVLLELPGAGSVTATALGISGRCESNSQSCALSGDGSMLLARTQSQTGNDLLAYDITPGSIVFNSTISVGSDSAYFAYTMAAHPSHPSTILVFSDRAITASNRLNRLHSIDVTNLAGAGSAPYFDVQANITQTTQSSFPMNWTISPQGGTLRTSGEVDASSFQTIIAVDCAAADASTWTLSAQTLTNVTANNNFLSLNDEYGLFAPTSSTARIYNTAGSLVKTITWQDTGSLAANSVHLQPIGYAP